jgi:hypothetical protein
MAIHFGPGSVGVHVDGQAEATVTATLPAGSYRLFYEPNPDGVTVMRVVAPAGARVQAWQGRRLVAEDEAPMSFAAQPDAFYRLVITLPDGRVWERRLPARARHTGSLSLLVGGAGGGTVVASEPPVAGPMAMSDLDFATLVSALRHESFENQRLDVLRSAASAAYFTVAQVGQLVDLYDFSNGKVKAVEITRGHIVDAQNAFQLYSHLTFEADKARVRRILGQ